MNAVIDFSEIHYEKVPGTTTKKSTGIVPADGQKVVVTKIRLSGSGDPKAYSQLIWDHGGGAEKVLASTRGDVEYAIDSSNSDFHITGDAVKKLQIVIENEDGTQSPMVGGSYEATIIG